MIAPGELMIKCARLSCAIYPPAVATGEAESIAGDTVAFFRAVDEIGFDGLDFTEAAETGTEFGIARDPRRGMLYIVIRGTAGLRDIMTDASAWRESVNPRGRAWRLHAGGIASARSCYDVVGAYLANHRSDTIVITGQSLGGMVARILRGMLPTTKANAVGHRRLNCVTFGAPRSGCPTFAADLDRQPGIDFRVEHLYDPIPYLPGAITALTPWPRYKHAGKKYPPPSARKFLAAHACAHYVETISQRFAAWTG